MHLIGACGLLFLCPRILELFVWAILVVCILSVFNDHCLQIGAVPIE